MAKLRGEFAATGKADRFDKLATLIDKESPPWQALRDGAAEMGVSPGALRMAVHRMRRRYRELLREEIAQTVSSPEEIDKEIHFSFARAERLRKSRGNPVTKSPERFSTH